MASSILILLSKESLIPLSPYPLRNSRCKPLGLAYGLFDTHEDAQSAIDCLNNTQYKTRDLHVQFHQPYVPGERRGSLRGFNRNRELGSPEVPNEPRDLNGSGEIVGSNKILNGLKAKADVAEAVTSTQNHDLENNLTSQRKELVDNGKVNGTAAGGPASLKRLSTYSGTKAGHRTKGVASPASPEGEVRSSILDSEDNAYSNDTIFIRGLKGKYTKAGIAEYFKAYNPISVKIIKVKKFPKSFHSHRSNVLIKFDFKDGNDIDKVLKECQNCLFDGNPFNVDKAFIRKSAMSPSSSLAELSASLPKEDTPVETPTQNSAKASELADTEQVINADEKVEERLETEEKGNKDAQEGAIAGEKAESEAKSEVPKAN